MIKAAILGAGFVAQLHALAYAQDPGVKLCAVCDANLPLAQKLAQEQGMAAYEDAHTLLEAEKPDVVSICLPSFLHEEYTVLALKAGAHVLCEKPLALTLDACQRMAQAAKDAQRLLMAGQVLRWWGEYQTIAAQLTGGGLGELMWLHAGRRQVGKRGGWLQDPQKSGGALYDFHIHDVDYVLSLMGTDIRTVYAAGRQGELGAWRQIDTLLTFEDGRVAHLEACNDLPEGSPFRAFLEARCQNGTLRYHFETAVNISADAKTLSTLQRRCGEEITDLPLADDNAQQAAFQREIHAFVAAVRSHSPAPLPIEETLRVMRCIELIKRSLETGTAMTNARAFLYS